MTKIELMTLNGVFEEYKPESRWAYNRRINRALRYVCPMREAVFSWLETIFWAGVVLAGAASAVIFLVLFARWWLCV